MTRSARPARMDKPLRCRPLEGRRDQRSPLRRCFKPRPPLSAGCAGFASGCRLSGSESDDRKVFRRLLRAAVRPLVRMPTNRHAATGTCEIGRAANRLVRQSMQEFFARAPIFFRRRDTKWSRETFRGTKMPLATRLTTAAGRLPRSVCARAPSAAALTGRTHYSAVRPARITRQIVPLAAMVAATVGRE
jgi:hypothetical protein